MLSALEIPATTGVLLAAACLALAAFVVVAFALPRAKRHIQQAVGELIDGRIASLVNDRVVERVNREILTREEAIEALRRAEAKYRGIFENAVEGIFQTTPEGRYLSANPALARLYGYDTPEQLMTSVGDIERQLYVDANRRHDFTRLMDEQGVAANFESQIYRRDRTIIWISECARPVRNDQGEVEYYEGTVVDISARKYSESLFVEKEAAEAANQAKTQFLANMSHELRTPLNGVIGMLDLLAETSPTPQQKRYTAVARSSANMLLNVINQILDFSKIEAGKLELESVEFNLRAIIEESLEMLAPQAARKGLELALNVPTGFEPAVRGDAHRLQQIIINLLGNAIKFTERGQVQVLVSVAADTPDKLVVRVAVEDTGVGIPADRLERLFRSFSQVDASTTRQYGGTGLGLAISKQLVELMHGSIGVESQTGRGSSFWFRVALAKCRPATLKRQLATPELSGLRVLVVDDNGTNREILFRQLSALGLRVETASEGKSALEKMRGEAAAGNPLDLAIVDCHMPVMDGYELTRRIRDDNALRSTPLVMLTSLATALTSDEYETLGISGFLTKPVSQARLCETLVQVRSAHSAKSGRDDRSRSESAAVATFPPESRSLANAPRGPRSRIRLLLAEDNEINRTVALEVLGAAGFQCDIATTGREAIERLIAAPYDMILMDCQMPEMDGLAATREIRRLELAGELRSRHVRVPIVAITANAIEGDRELCEAAGMDGYITKPIDSLKLIDLLDALIGVSGSVGLEAPKDSQPTDRGARAEQSADEVVVEPPFDLEDLSYRCLGNQELMQRIFMKLADRLPHDLQRMAENVQRGLLTEAARDAHAMRGSAANLSANRLREFARELEAACAEGNAPRAERSLASIRGEVARCLEFIGSQEFLQQAACPAAANN
jgi:PAS domain S-box-containing protein